MKAVCWVRRCELRGSTAAEGVPGEGKGCAARWAGPERRADRLVPKDGSQTASGKIGPDGRFSLATGP